MDGTVTEADLFTVCKIAVLTWNGSVKHRADIVDKSVELSQGGHLFIVDHEITVEFISTPLLLSCDQLTISVHIDVLLRWRLLKLTLWRLDGLTLLGGRDGKLRGRSLFFLSSYNLLLLV